MTAIVMMTRCAARQWNAYTAGERLHQDMALTLGMSASMTSEPAEWRLWNAWNDTTGRVLTLISVKED